MLYQVLVCRGLAAHQAGKQHGAVPRQTRPPPVAPPPSESPTQRVVHHAGKKMHGINFIC